MNEFLRAKHKAELVWICSLYETNCDFLLNQTSLCIDHRGFRQKMGEHFCSPMQQTLLPGQKRTDIYLLVSTRLLMYSAQIAARFWVGSMKEPTRNLRNTRKVK